MNLGRYYLTYNRTFITEMKFHMYLLTYLHPVAVVLFAHLLRKLLFLALKLLQNYSVYFLPQFQNQSFLKRLLVLFIGEWYQKTSSECQVSSLLLGYHFFKPSQIWSKEIYVCTLTSVYTHTYKYHCVCIYNKLNMSSYGSLQIYSITIWIILPTFP